MNNLYYPMMASTMTLLLSPIYGTVVGPWIWERYGQVPALYALTVLCLWPMAWMFFAVMRNESRQQPGRD